MICTKNEEINKKLRQLNKINVSFDKINNIKELTVNSIL